MSSLLLSLMFAAGSPAPDAAESGPSLPQERSADAERADGTPSVTRPVVHVVVDEALEEWLLVRLLEDGYPLAASADAAEVELTVTSSAQGSWRVTAVGASTVAVDVATDTDLAVIRLELLHRSLDALEDVEPRTLEQPKTTAVSFAIADASAPALAARVATEILAAGATLTPQGTAAQLHVCAEQAEGEASPRVVVLEGTGDCTWPLPTADVDAGVPRFPSTTRQVEEAMAALHAPEPEPPEPEPQPEPPEPVEDSESAPGLKPPPEPESTSPDENDLLLAPTPGARVMLRGGVGLGLVGRIADIDSVIAASMTIGKEPGIAGWLELQVRPATVVGALRVVEVVPAAGLQFRPLVYRRFSVFTGALLGAEVHRYRFEVDGERTSGLHTGVTVEGALGLAMSVWKRHELQLSMRVGQGVRRAHDFEFETIWSREGFRIGAMLGFAFGRKVGR